MTKLFSWLKPPVKPQPPVPVQTIKRLLLLNILSWLFIKDPIFMFLAAVAAACGMYHVLFKVTAPDSNLIQGRYAVGQRLNNLKPYCPEMSSEISQIARLGPGVCFTQDAGEQTKAIFEILKAHRLGPMASIADALVRDLSKTGKDPCIQIYAKVKASCPGAFAGLDFSQKEALRKAIE